MSFDPKRPIRWKFHSPSLSAPEVVEVMGDEVIVKYRTPMGLSAIVVPTDSLFIENVPHVPRELWVWEKQDGQLSLVIHGRTRDELLSFFPSGDPGRPVLFREVCEE